MKLLETKSLSIGYRKGKNTTSIIQKDINLSVEPGQIISLMGQNGVGKTTFIKSICGLLPVLDGQVFYHGQDLKRIRPKDLARQISIVLTEKPFNQTITVLELIAIGRHPYSGWLGTLGEKDKGVIDWAISETNINYLANKKLYELSDGQMQKVMIARALVQETDLILLDEPAAHLDLYNKIEVMILLRKIAKTGKGIIISTHDMQVSTQLSDLLWLFNFNEPVTSGTPEDLILNGSLEKTLYLHNHGYDMIHGIVVMDQHGPKVSVIGEEDRKFWTIQALKRNGYQIDQTAEITVEASTTNWLLKTNNDSMVLESIEELVKALKFGNQNIQKGL
ncbi:MAG: ABC transporter ATP-binding protein [Marinoscillum sp.]